MRKGDTFTKHLAILIEHQVKGRQVFADLERFLGWHCHPERFCRLSKILYSLQI